MQYSTGGRHQLPSDVAARFSAAEARLYPLAMVDVERYQRGTALCGLLLQELRSSCPDVASVLDRRHALLDLVPDVAESAGIGIAGLDAETLVDAASALRCREVQQQHIRNERTERLTRARAAGETWVVDEPSPAEVMSGMYRTVETHVATGTELVSTVEVGTAGRPTRFVLEVVPADEEHEAPPSEVFDDQDDWRRAVERRRSDISGHP